MVRELVALDLPGGPAFVDALRRVWDAGDAAAPLDPRLPKTAALALLATLAPGKLLGPDGEMVTLPGGRGVEDGDALVVATSGSTGTARAAVLTHAAVQASATSTSKRLGVDPTRHRWLACLPLAHIGGLSVVTRAMLTGTPCTVTDGFDAAFVSEQGRTGGATHVSLVSAALLQVDPTLFSCVLLGGAAPPSELASNVVTTYGMTETGSGVVYDGVPLEGVEVAVGDGTPGAGRDGELLVRGPMLLRTYRDGTEPFLPGPDGGGGWLPTGDAGRISPSGLVEVHGRLSEVINTGGEKVWPAAVEKVISLVPGVAEVAVWRRPDPKWGERVVAWVVAADHGPPPRPEEVRAAVRGVLAPWAVPKEVLVVGSLPKTASGKVRRASLC